MFNFNKSNKLLKSTLKLAKKWDYRGNYLISFVVYYNAIRIC